MRVRCVFYVWIALMSLLTACDRGKTSSSIKENHPTVDFPKDASKLLKVGIQTQPTSLDPRKMEEISQEPLFRLLFEGLTTLGKEGTLIKALAKEITPSNNYRTYTFTLREAFWSDGSLVTANDFLEAWTEALDPNFTCPKVKDFFVIDRAREVKEGSISADQLGVFASDDNTLIVHLNKIYKIIIWEIFEKSFLLIIF